MHQNQGHFVVKSIRRGLLAGILGLVLSLGLIDTFLGGRFSLISLFFDESSQYFLEISAETGIREEKLLLLDYFTFLPWPVTNLHQISYINQIGYPRELERSSAPFLLLFHGIYFYLGALLSITLSGGEKTSREDDLRWKPWKRGIYLPPWFSLTSPGRPSPWVIFTLFTVGVHIVLMGVATSYYTGPGGPAWVYPSPIQLLLFITGVGLISYSAQVTYKRLQQVIKTR